MCFISCGHFIMLQSIDTIDTLGMGDNPIPLHPSFYREKIVPLNNHIMYHTAKVVHMEGTFDLATH